MPNFISRIVDRESKRWQDLIGDVFQLYEKVAAIEKRFGDLCIFLENDVNGKLAKKSFVEGCSAL